MTRSTGARAAQRIRCGKCGSPGRWGEACVLCGATYTESEKGWGEPLYPATMRVAHGTICTAEGEPHRCHCHGGKTHPCNCYESPGRITCHICGQCDCDTHTEAA